MLQTMFRPLARTPLTPNSSASSSRAQNPVRARIHRICRSAHSHPHALPFRPPPIRERLKPLIPFFIWWTILTSITVHTMRLRIEIKEDEARIGAKISVLEALLERTRRGEHVRPEEVRREFEMVGLRQRRVRTDDDGRVEAKDVGWREAIFGRRGPQLAGGPEGEEETDVKEQDLGAWAAEGESSL